MTICFRSVIQQRITRFVEHSGEIRLNLLLAFCYRRQKKEIRTLTMHSKHTFGMETALNNRQYTYERAMKIHASWCEMVSVYAIWGIVF